MTAIGLLRPRAGAVKIFESKNEIERISKETNKPDMKTAFHLNHRRDGDDRLARRFPLIDCNYQATSYLDLRGGHWAELPAPSFRNISRDYFRGEARYNFVIESVLLGAVIITSAVAIWISTVAAIDLLRALGYF